MGRTPRIEYEGAVYHVMCRGNRQESIFRDSQDHEMFLNTLDETCGQTGWRVHAFCLMGNHYHLLIETPYANLVDGMRRLQSTYTKRFNVRHKVWGHLFQSRYKALLVDPEEDYFPTVSNYIHLNPARAKCFDLDTEVLSAYPWSSYSLYLRPAKRPDWLSVKRTLGNLGFKDDVSGRAKYRQYMKRRVQEVADSDHPQNTDDRWKKIRRGWCFGGETFRERMVESLDQVMKGKRRDSFAGDEANRHDTLEGERLFNQALKKLKLQTSELSALKKSDPRKKAIAWLIRKNTSVKNEWISRQIQMGCVSNMSQFVREVEDSAEGPLYELKRTLK